MYRDDLEPIINRLNTEIQKLYDKKEEYIEKTEKEITMKEFDAAVLMKLAEELPEKQPDLTKEEKDVSYDDQGEEPQEAAAEDEEIIEAEPEEATEAEKADPTAEMIETQ